MSIRNRTGLATFAALAAMVAMALAATTASATIVVPPSTAITATSASTIFIPENAYSTLFVKCTSSTAKFTTPAGRVKGGTTRVGEDANINRTSIGTQSTGPGGVTMDLSSIEFAKCGLFNGSTEVAPATVNTTTGWSLSGEQGPSEATGWAAIGVPKAGAEIFITGVGTVVVSPSEASAVIAPEYKNSTHVLHVDSQIALSGAGLVSPAQFEANYTANNSLEILP